MYQYKYREMQGRIHTSLLKYVISQSGKTVVETSCYISSINIVHALMVPINALFLSKNTSKNRIQQSMTRTGHRVQADNTARVFSH